MENLDYLHDHGYLSSGVLGLVVPAILTAGAIVIIASDTAVLIGNAGIHIVHGQVAMFLGWACFGLGVFFAARYGIRRVRAIWLLSAPLQVLALVAFITCVILAYARYL